MYQKLLVNLLRVRALGLALTVYAPGIPHF